LLDGLEKSWREYLKELKRFREEFSNEAVHDLRVATRRMIAIVQLLHSMTPRPRLQKIIRTLKEHVGDLDDLRDTQVILVAISETIQKRQQRQEDSLLRTLRKRLRKFGTRELAKRVWKAHDSLRREIDNDLQSGILRAVDEAHMMTNQCLSAVDLTHPMTIHRVRIAFTKFRYTVELINSCFQTFVKQI
jgi:CHAD domain-containing protein